MESMVTFDRLRYTIAYLTPDICSLINRCYGKYDGIFGKNPPSHFIIGDNSRRQGAACDKTMGVARKTVLASSTIFAI